MENAPVPAASSVGGRPADRAVEVVQEVRNRRVSVNTTSLSLAAEIDATFGRQTVRFRLFGSEMAASNVRLTSSDVRANRPGTSLRAEKQAPGEAIPETDQLLSRRACG